MLNSFLVFALLLGVVLCQSPCCAPKGWSTFAKTFRDTGDADIVFLIIDGEMDQVYINVYNPRYQFEIWFMNNTVYEYDENAKVCHQANGNYFAFCVGSSENDTFDTTVSINGDNTAVWARSNPDSTTSYFAVNSECFPVSIETDRNNDENRFLHVDLVYNTTTEVPTIPPLPSACQQSSSSLFKEVANLDSKSWFVSMLYEL